MSYIDTRDLAERRDELLALHDPANEGSEDWTPWTREDREEFDEIKAIEDEVSEFNHGETMIPTWEFEDLARELAKDIGAISGEEGWPLSYIDWEAAADALTADYVEVNYQGEGYYARST